MYQFPVCDNDYVTSLAHRADMLNEAFSLVKKDCAAKQQSNQVVRNDQKKATKAKR